MSRGRFWKVGKWVAMMGGATTFVIYYKSLQSSSHCSPSSNWTPANPSYVPFRGTWPKWDYNWDKREKNQRPKATRHLILIRHGDYNLKGSCDGEMRLTQVGVEQAQLTGDRLNASGIRFSSFHTSNLTRAIQTSEIILSHLGQAGLVIGEQDPLLQESKYPCKANPPVTHIRIYSTTRMEPGLKLRLGNTFTESQAGRMRRIPLKSLLPIRTSFVILAMQLPPQGWRRLSLNHASLTMLSIPPSGRVILRCLGDSGHLPASKMTTSTVRSGC